MSSFTRKRFGKQPAKNTLPDLPYEIWMHVASFIPLDVLKGLIQIHRAFFDLAMREVYREVFIYHEGEYSTNRCLNTMG